MTIPTLKMVALALPLVGALGCGTADATGTSEAANPSPPATLNAPAKTSTVTLAVTGMT